MVIVLSFIISAFIQFNYNKLLIVGFAMSMSAMSLELYGSSLWAWDGDQLDSSSCTFSLIPISSWGSGIDAYESFFETSGERMQYDDEGNEVELMETSEYGNTDLNSIISGDKDFAFEDSESFARAGFTKQEFDAENEELVNVDEDDYDDSDDSDYYDDMADDVFDED